MRSRLMHRERELLSKIMEMSPIGICIVDAEGHIVAANAKAEEVLGLDRAEITQRTYNDPRWHITSYDGGPFPDEELPFQVVRRTLRPAYGVQHAIEWPNGRRVFLRINAAPLLGAGRRFEGMVAVFEDCTREVLAERALRESESRHRLLAELAQDIIVLLDLEGRILYVNPAGCQAVGLSSEQVLGRFVTDFFPPEEAARIQQRLAQRAAGRSPGRSLYQGEFLDPAGRRVPVEISSTLVRHPDGSASVLAIARDLRERRQAEQLREALHGIALAAITDESLPEVYRCVHQAIATLMPAQMFYIALRRPGAPAVSIVYHTLEERTRRERVGARGKTEYVLRTGRTLLADRALLEQLAAAGQIEPESALEPIYSYLGVPLFYRGEAIGVMAVYSCQPEVAYGPQEQQLLEYASTQVAMAIGRRWEAELLAERERFLDTLLGNLPGMAYRCLNDRDWTMLYVSRGCLELTGYEREELIGNAAVSYAQLIHPEDRERVWQEVQGALSKGMPFTMEYRIRTRDGKLKWVWERGLGVANGDGMALEGFISDVTERRLLQEQLLQAGRLEAVGRLAGGVAHDFNNLLTAIAGHARFILDGLAPESPLAEDAQSILKVVNRAAELTRQLLAFSRRQVLSPQVLDLNELLSGWQKMLRRLLGEDIRLELELAQGLWPVCADPTQVEQVILNLAVNARDAMPRGGTLHIKTRNEQLAGSLAASVGAAPGDYVLLCVRDTGVGMTEEVRRRIFEPFFTTKDLNKGTGLGLATVYGIVKQHGGAIHVESEPGEGAAFYVYLPRHLGQAEPAREAQELPARARGQGTVLVVEDDAAVRRVTARILEGAGYRVLVAASAQEALELAAAERELKVVVSDIVMPGTDGLALLSKLRSLHPGLPAVFVTGYSEQLLAERGLDATAGGAVLSKPFSAAALLNAVAQQAQRRAEFPA